MNNNKSPKTSKSPRHKFDTEICEDNMTFSDCEVAILKNAKEENDNAIGQELVNSTEIRKMINIVRDFIIDKKLICYGGTAINNILPQNVQFYDYSVEIPDFDFYSKDPLNDAINLANIYYAKGFTNVEAKAGMHKGTFKVFVNFIGIADITHMNKILFDNLMKESIVNENIHYAPVNFLRMGMYLELSRPKGDTDRWEKVVKRLNLLNKYYPFSKNDCRQIDFETASTTTTTTTTSASPLSKANIYVLVREELIKEGVVFFGGYARRIYSKYMPKENSRLLNSDPIFDVLSNDHDVLAGNIKKILEANNIHNIKIEKHEAFGELIPEYSEISIKGEPLVFIYAPIACHSYNVVNIGPKLVNIATIETILTFYLTFIYVGKTHYNTNRLICMAKYLFELMQKNRLTTTGVLKHFTTTCIGEQETIQSILEHKSKKFEELKKNPNSDEYKQWFLKYIPGEAKQQPTSTTSPKATTSPTAPPQPKAIQQPKMKQMKPQTYAATTKRTKRRPSYRRSTSKISRLKKRDDFIV